MVCYTNILFERNVYFFIYNLILFGFYCIFYSFEAGAIPASNHSAGQVFIILYT